MSPGTSAAFILQVSTSKGGVPKRPVPPEGVQVGELGLEGDVQRNRLYHGGPDRAVCLYASERLDALAAEGHPIGPGSAGENVTTRGLDWDLVVPGAKLRLGADVLIEITDYAPPCKQNRQWFQDGDFSRLSQRLHPGWSRAYARVLKPGRVRAGDRIELIRSSE